MHQREVWAKMNDISIHALLAESDSTVDTTP